MKNQKEIYCPYCKEKVGTYDGKSTMDYVTNCRRCKKRIIYHVDNGKVEIKPILPRSCSSGMTFY